MRNVNWMTEAARYARGEQVESRVASILAKMLELEGAGQSPKNIASYLQRFQFVRNGALTGVNFNYVEVKNILTHIAAIREQERATHFPGNDGAEAS